MKKHIKIILLIQLFSCSEVSELSIINLIGAEVESIKYLDNFEIDGVSMDNELIVSWARRNQYFNLYDHNLNFIKSIGRYGSGPGEFLTIENVYLTENQLIIYDSHKRTFELFTRDGAFVNSITVDRQVNNIFVKNDTVMYVNSFEPNAFAIIRLFGANFENYEYIYSQRTREILQSYNSLRLFDDILTVNRVLSNQIVLIDTKTLKSKTITNDYLPSGPEYVYQGEFKFPTGPVWRTGLIVDDVFLQVKNNKGSGSEIYRFNNQGKIDLKYVFDEPISNLFLVESEVWIFTSKQLIKYHVDLFKQEENDKS